MQIFEQPEYSSFDKYDRRFSELQRRLKEFQSRWNGVFPEYWGIICYIIYEFCSQTMISVSDLLKKNGRNIDTKLLIDALTITIQFEQKVTDQMQAKYEPFLKKLQGDASNPENK